MAECFSLGILKLLEFDLVGEVGAVRGEDDVVDGEDRVGGRG